MDPILQISLSWRFIAIAAVAICGLALLIRNRAVILTGIAQLLESPSGVFALLTLFAITLVTLKQPSVGGSAFAAFVAVVPTILTWVEHKETILQMSQSASVAAPLPPPPPDAPPPPPDPGLPARGSV